MKTKGIALLIGLLVLSFVLAGCASTPQAGSSAAPSASTAVTGGPSASGASASPAASPAASDSSSTAPSAAPSAAPSVAPSVAPNGFVMGKVTSISGNTITLSTVNPTGTKTITTDNNTSVTVSGSLKTATLTDVAVGDVLSVTLNGSTALILLDDGPNVNPDPSAYISPSPSPSPSAAAASPSAT